MQDEANTSFAPSAKTHALNFTERQNRLVSGAITLLAGVLSAGIVWWLLSTTAGFVGHHSNVLLPPVAAVVLAMICKPLYDRLVGALWGSHSLAVAAVCVVVFVPLGLFLWFFGALVVEQAVRFVDRLPDLYRQLHAATVARLPELRAFLEERGMLQVLDRFNPETWVDEFLRQVGGTAYSVGSRVLHFVGGVLGWLVLPIYTAFFLATRPLDGGDVRKLLVFASPKTRDNVAFLVDQFLGIVVVFFRGQVLVACIQGLLFGIGFQVLGLDYGLLLGLCLGLLNVVPYLGNMVGLAVTLPLAVFGSHGSVGRLVGVLVVFSVVQMLDSYIITPRVMGNRTGLNAFVVIFSLFFWNAVIGGALGMILAIPLSAFIVVFWRLLKREYFPPELEEKRHCSSLPSSMPP
jgi:predicted PurR-regulated permease PerM